MFSTLANQQGFTSHVQVSRYPDGYCITSKVTLVGYKWGNIIKGSGLLITKLPTKFL
jgi:hypothetical protein